MHTMNTSLVAAEFSTEIPAGNERDGVSDAAIRRSSKRHIQAVYRGLVVSVLCYIAAHFDFMLTIPDEGAPLVITVLGVGVACLLLFGLRTVPGMFAGVLIAHLAATERALSPVIVGADLVALIFLTAAYCVAAFITAWMLLRIIDLVDFPKTPSDFLTLVGVAALGSTVCLIVELLGWGYVGFGAGNEPSGGQIIAFASHWLGSIAGIILIVPVLLAWKTTAAAPTPTGGRVESLAFMLTTALFAQTLFGSWLVWSADRSVEYLVIPLFIWAAYRLSGRACAVGVVIFSAIALSNVLHQAQEQMDPVQMPSLLNLQGFLVVLAVSANAISAGVRLRFRALNQLSAINRALEQRISHHSRELTRQSGQLVRHATTDHLTGLANRREFSTQMEKLLGPSAAEEESHVLCYLDLDHFRIINDTCGPVAGDRYLRTISQLIKSNVRSWDTVARIGGDEFALILRYCPVERAVHVARKICTAISQYKFECNDHHLALTASAGVVPVQPGVATVGEIMFAADAACSVASECGGDHVQLYRPDDSLVSSIQSGMKWISRINCALEYDSFELVVQRIVPTKTPQSPGEHFEVLLRMRDGERLVGPGEFLPAAERYQIAPRIDRWVLRKTLEFLSAHPDLVRNTRTCAINLSGQTLSSPEFVSYAVDLLTRSTVPPSIICFEITETAAIDNLNNATTMIDALRDLGCRFALDDFGSGLSSFGYLRQLHVDFVKIDGQFVRNILDDPVDFSMVSYINEIGHLMGKKTIAEFVENEAILLSLQDLGVDYAQGYGIARPQPIESLVSEVSSSTARAKSG